MSFAKKNLKDKTVKGNKLMGMDLKNNFALL